MLCYQKWRIWKVSHRKEADDDKLELAISGENI